MNEETKQAVDLARDPTTYHWLTYAWVLTLSAWGGIVKFLSRIKHRRSFRDALVDLGVGLVTSTFAGVVTFFICEATKIEPMWSAVAIAISGHMGAEAIRLFQNSMRERFPLIFGRRESDRAE